MSEYYGRGRRGGRGGRGGNNHFKPTTDYEAAGSSEGSGTSRSRPPPGLTGRQKGLWYRDQRSKQNRTVKNEVDERIRNSFSCALTDQRQKHLTALIYSLSTSDYNGQKSSAGFRKKYQNNLQENDRADLASVVKVKTEIVEPAEDDFDENATPELDMKIEVKTENVELADDSFDENVIPDLDLKNEMTTEDVEPSDNNFNGTIFSASRDAAFDEILLQKLQEKEESKGYQKMQTFRQTLPAFNLREKIVQVVRQNQVTIISGETGCGKTTQVAQFILDSEILENRGSACNIVCTQPRRISAISVAERVAAERNEPIGQSIGYSIRLEHRFARNPSGKITFMTTGVMFQCLQSNPNLDNLSHLIIDEVHERSIHSDFLLTIVKDILPRRPSLKLILMSATMNAAEFSDYYGLAPIIEIPGFTFPITEHYLEDALEHTKFVFEQDYRPKFQQQTEESFETIMTESYLNELVSKKYSERTIQQLQKPCSEEVNPDFIQALIEHISNTDKTFGAILVFVTGWDLISKLSENLEYSGKFPKSSFRIYPLHSMMPTVNQKEIFSKPPHGTRKIVIATQIAETSITIEDILWVIDCGKIKLGNFDEINNLATLDVEWVSLANAQQRRGRAGRTKAGHVYHLFSRPRKAILESFKKPEILRSRLEETILQIKILKLGKAHTFLKRLLDPPSTRAIDLALETLQQLHALDQDEKLTPLGFHLAHLPMDPQTGKMILMGAIFSCIDPVFSIAASLSFKDPFYRPLGKEREVDEIRRSYSKRAKSDHIILSEVIYEYEKAAQGGFTRQFCYRNFLSESTVKMLVNMKSQLAGYLCKLGFLKDTDYKAEDLNRNSRNLGIVTAVTAAGLYPNVVSIRFMGKRGRCDFRCGEVKVSIHPGSVNCGESKFTSPYLVYFKKVRSSQIFLHDTTMVNPFALIFFGGMLKWDMVREGGPHGHVTVDEKYEFSYPREQNFRFLVESLRTELDKFLEFKVNNPGPVDWSADSKEGCLLRAIVELLTCEYEAFMPSVEDDEYDGGSGSYNDHRRNDSYQQKRPYWQRNRY